MVERFQEAFTPAAGSHLNQSAHDSLSRDIHVTSLRCHAIHLPDFELVRQLCSQLGYHRRKQAIEEDLLASRVLVVQEGLLHGLDDLSACDTNHHP